MSASPNTPGNAFGTPLFFKTEQELLSANLPAGVTAYAFNTGKFYNRSDSSWSGVVDSQSLGEPLQDLPDLRAVPPDSRSDKQVRLVEDSKAQYFFDSTGTGPDNGDTVIVPDVGTGAWFKIGGDGDVLGSINTWTAQNTFTGGFAATGSTAIFQKTGTVGTVANEVVILAERSETQFQGAAIQIMSGSGNLAKLIFSDSNTPESGSVTMDNSFFNQMSLRIGTTPRMILNTAGVVIGNAQPAGNQALSVISTTGTFLPPRMSNTDRTNLGVVADGSIIYNTDGLKFNFYENGAWKQLDSLLSSNNFWSNTNSFTQQFDVINSQGVRFSRGGGVTALGPEESALFRNINAGTQIKFQCQNTSQCGLQLRDAAGNGGSFLYTPNTKTFDWETSGGTGSVMTLTASSLDILTGTGARIGSNLIGAPGFGEQVSIQNSAGPAVMGLQANDTSECSMIFGSVTSAKQTEFIYDNNDGTFRFDFNGFFVAADATGMHIGDTTVNNDRLLELTSTTKTFVLNRMTTTERDLLAASAATAGALIYNSSINKLQFYNGTGWETVTSA